MNQSRQVVFVDRFHRLDWSIQLQRIQAATSRYNRARTYVDSTGVGEPIFEALRKEGVNCEAYSFTQKSKAALIDNLAMQIEQGTITLPRPDLWPDGIDELEAFEYSVTDNGSVKTGSPSGMHDDIVIALGLAAWHLKPRRKLVPSYRGILG